MLVLFKVYMKKEKIGFITPKLSLLWILFFSIISIFIRSGNAPFFPTIILFIILLNQSFFTAKKNRTISLILLIALIASTIYAFFNLEKIPILSIAYHPEFDISWASLTIFQGFFNSVLPNTPHLLLYSFYIGLALATLHTFSLLDKIKNFHRNNTFLNFKSDLFNLILLFSVLFAFIYLIRPNAIEFRWFFLILPPILIFTSKGIITFSEFIANLMKSKIMITIIILLILSIGVYDQITHADNIINSKLNSYSQIKDAGLWIKQNSEPGDHILTRSPNQITYYAERETSNYGQFTEEEFFELVDKTKPRYMLETALEPHPGQWGLEPTPDM